MKSTNYNQIEINPEFDDIRPYYDDEVPAVIDRLLKDTDFRRVMEYVLPGKEWEKAEAVIKTCRTKQEFQDRLSKKTIMQLAAKTAETIDCSGFENIEKGEAYTYISNHRDIVLDASILCVMLFNAGYDAIEIAIGDNLLRYSWIEDMVRLNKSFIVKRNVPFRQMLEVSNHLSNYIHFTIQQKKQSLWIAQREGRSKDSNDRTQESLIKMLAMGGAKDFFGNIKDLNITPVSLSYEYDPCDYLKAKEFQQRRDDPEFKKSQQDDLISMQTGLFGYKGNIHFQLGKPINSYLSESDALAPRNELNARIVSLIDKEIFLNYRFYPINYIAYDRLFGRNVFSENYTPEEVKGFDAYLQKQLDKIDLPNKDIPFLTEKIVEMYANPLKNQLEAK